MKRWIVLLFLFAVAFSVAFVADLQGVFKTVRHPIATLVEEEGTVRRLAVNELTWDRARITNRFAAYDTVSTGQSSFARLSFAAGGELELGPNSLVVLSGDLEDLNLNFLSGSGRLRVLKKANKKIRIQKSPSLPRVEVQEVQTIRPDPVPRPRLAKIELPPMLEEVSLRNPASFLRTEGEAVTAVRLLPIPDLRFPGSRSVVGFGKKTLLRWTVPKSENVLRPDRYEVVIQSLDQRNRRIRFRTARRQTDIRRFQLPAGSYRWSVRSLSQTGQSSELAEYRSLTIQPEKSKISTPRVLPVKVQ